MSTKKADPCQQNAEVLDFTNLGVLIDTYYSGREDALIQVLHAAQGMYGYLPLDLQKFVADKLNVPLSQVSGVVSFYSFFTPNKRGEHTIRMCLGTACYVRGGKKLVDHIIKTMDVEFGETTADGKFTFEIARCIGACGLAPAIMIDDDVYKMMTPEKLDKLLLKYKDQGGANHESKEH